MDSATINLHQRWRRALRSNDLAKATALLTVHRDRLDLESRQGIDGEGDLSSLDLAAQHGSPALIRLVRDAGAVLDATSQLQDTALHQAAGRARADAIRTLIEAGASLNPSNHLGYTPLMDAARTGVIDAVRPLLDAGASVHVADHNGQTALHHAMTRGTPDVAQALLDAGANPWTVDGNGHTPLHVMCEHVLAPAMLQDLVARARRDDVAWDVPDQQGLRPLHLSIEKGRLRTIDVLLGLGVAPDQPTGDGVSALDLARAYQEDEVFAHLQAACVAREQAALRATVPDEIPGERLGRRL